MKKFLLAATSVAAFATGGHAATVNLSDNSFDRVVFTSFVQGPLGPIQEFDEVVDGVTFTFSTAGQFRTVGTWGNGTSNASGPFALQFGGGGGNTSSFVLSVSSDVTLDSFTGHGSPNGNISSIFDVSGTGVSSVANTFSTKGFLGTETPVTASFVGGPLSLTAGQSYLFNTTNNSANTSAFFTAFDFSTASTVEPVPLPAGLPMLLAGLGVFGWMRRRQTA